MADHTRAGRPVPPVVRRFLDTEASGGALLVGAAAFALAWANLARDSYDRAWRNDVVLRIGSFGVEEDLQHFVNDGLMAVFFLVVGLEIKRELVTGDLRDRRSAALPVAAALGGMIVPAVIYLALNTSGAGRAGWGIPVATDIAFAVAVLALVGSRVPASLKLFLLSLAIVDDIGAIVVIAIFYAESIDMAALGLAAAAVLASLTLRRARVHWAGIHILLGVACWLATYNSGVHATIAGVVFGLLTPARPSVTADATSPAERLQQALHPFSSFLIVPVFALANAGVPIRFDSFEAPSAWSVAAGVVSGLVVGKLVGVAGASWLAVRLGIARLPDDVTWRDLTATAALAGIGFTVSLFLTNLAFDDAQLRDAAKLAVLLASVAASLVGAALLLRRSVGSDHS